jgi:hypothetical protein
MVSEFDHSVAGFNGCAWNARGPRDCDIWSQLGHVTIEFINNAASLSEFHDDNRA